MRGQINISLFNTSCKITIPQNSTNLTTLIKSGCNAKEVERLTSAYTWTRLDSSTCTWAGFTGDDTFTGVPTDNDVGTCALNFDVKNKATGEVKPFKANINVTNLQPTLSITQGAALQNSPLTQIKADVDVQANEEGMGFYSLNPSGTTSPRCTDHGTVVVNPTTGAVQYQPAINWVDDCYIGVEFNDQNPSNNTVTANFVVKISLSNTTPVINGTCLGAATQDIAYNCNALSVFDLDVADVHTWYLTGANTCSWLAINSSTGVISGTPNDNQVGTCTLAVNVYDGIAFSTTYSRTITVANVAPSFNPVPGNPSGLLEDSPLTVIKSATEIQVTDEGYGVYSLDNATTTSPKCSDNGTLSINTANGAVSFLPNLNYDGTCYFKIKFDDQNPTINTVTRELFLTMTPVNDAPVITSTCPTSLNELTPYNCVSTFTDAENNPVTWTKLGTDTCTWLSVNSATGQVTGTPARADVGTCLLSYVANDGYANSASYTSTITVNNVAPIVNAVNVSLAEDSASTIINTAAQVTSTDEGYGTYSIAAASSNDCQAKGTVSINASNGELTYAPLINFDTSCKINIKFDDGKTTNNLGYKEITVTMIPSPDNATVSLPVGCQANQNEDVAYSCTPIIVDPDTGDTHTWSIDSNTCAFVTQASASTGVMSGTPNDNNVGTCSFTIKATGNQDALVTNTLTANLTINNVKPVLTGTNPVLILMNAAAANIQNMNSTDENYGVYSLVAASSIPCDAQKAQPITIDPQTGVINYKPLAKFAGLCKIKVMFDDENSINNVEYYEFTVNVQDFIPPVIESIDSPTGNGTYTLGQTITIDVKFDEEIVVNTTLGTPRLFLETGAVDRYADYVGLVGANNDTLRFTYTVQEGDYSTDLDIHSTVSTLDLRDATVKDRFNNFQLNYALPLFPSATSLKANRDIFVNGNVGVAVVTGLPTRVSPDLKLDATVGGSDVVNYRYKITDITLGTQACTNATGYSADIPVATKLTDSLVSYSSGTTLRICVLGVNSNGIVAPLTSAFSYVWTKDLFSVAKVSFASVTNLSNWQDSEVDPDNNNIIYARNMLGEIYKSTDFGATWKINCTVPQTYESSLEVSPGPDRTPFAFQSGRAYKIIDNEGGVCTDVYANGGFPQTAVTTYNMKNYSFTANGDLYIGFIDGANFKIYRSFNQGSTWSLFSTTSTLGTVTISFAIHPYNPNTIIYSFYKYLAPSVSNIYLSLDAGITKNSTSGVFSENLYNFKWDVFNTSYIFSSLGTSSHKSSNTGTSWIADNPYADLSNILINGSYYRLRRWDIDKLTGYAYRVSTDSTNTYLQKSTNLYSGSTTTWSTIYTFPTFGYYDAGLNVSVSGNSADNAKPTIAINIKNQFFVSTDGGVSFTEIYAVKELKLASISSFGDGAIYGATADWAVVKTTDNGKNWVYKQYDYSQCLGVPPRISVNREDNNKVLTWSENYTASNCANFNYSVDGMNTQISRDAFSIVAPFLQVPMSINDPKNFYIMGKPSGSFIANTTENNAYENLQVTLTGLEFSSPMPDSYISPVDKNKVWIAENVSTGYLYEYNILDKTRTNLTANTGLTSIAAIDSYIDINGAYGLRVMDRTGKLKVSNDFGATFANEGNASGTLSSCTKRFLYHHPKDRTLLLTACLSTNIFAYSKDNGATWTQIDTLTKFTLDCNIKGIALSSSKIFLACRNSDTYEFNYTSVENINDINDNILTEDEQLTPSDLINHLYPATYDEIKYAVIADGEACDNSTPGLSLAVPKSDDPKFTVRGGYRICIEQKDSAGGYTYTTSTLIFYDKTNPVFTSIDLINDAADGKITYIESFNQKAIVGNLVSSSHDFVKYAVVADATTCDGSLSYTYLVPQSLNDSLKLTGTYKVCVQLTTKGKLSPVYGQSSSFVLEPTTVIAKITNTPVDFISTDSALDVIITGTNVTKYKYKIIGNGSSCKPSTGYSAETPIATHITSDLTGYVNGTHLKLCVIGSDASDNWQSYEKASEFFWIRSTNLIATRMNFENTNTLSAWRNVAVHQINPNLMYAINDMGEIYKTENAGTNWEIMCRVNTYMDDMHFKLSPGEDATAYVSYYNNDYNSASIIASLVFRVDSKNGEPCPNIMGDFRGLSAPTFYHSPLAIDNKGIIYYAEDQYNSVVLRRSLDFGKTWQFVGQLQSKGLRAGLFIHPTNSNYMLITTLTSNGTNGLSRSTDGGKNWAFIRSDSYFTSNPNIYFDPINAGRVYTNTGMLSTDYGLTWVYTASLDVGASRRWFVDSTGNGYQSTIFGGTTRIKKSTGMDPINFIDLKSFSTTGSNIHATISSAGTNIAVITNKQLHISTDSGATWTQIFWPGKNIRLSGIDSANGQKQYAVSTAMKVFRSDNNGSLWTYKFQYYDQYCHRYNGYNPNYNRVMAHPLFPDTAYVFSTGCLTNSISTADGFDNSVLMGRGAYNYSNYLLAPFATSNVKAEYLYSGDAGAAGGRSTLTNDLFSTESLVNFTVKESLSLTNQSPFGISYLGNIDNTMYIQGGNLLEVRRDEKITTAITNRLTFSNPAAIRLTHDQSDIAYNYIVISSDGKLNKSKDNAVSFQSFGSGAPGLTTCPSRILATYPNDPNIMATVCYGGNDIAWTTDNGTTWSQYTLTTSYNMNCSLVGVTIDHSKINFACANDYDGLYFYHNPVRLENLASDNILLPGDNDGQDLVSIYNASKYVSIQYDIILEGATCNASNTYSSTTPKGSSLVASGNYQICTKLFDGFTTRYVKSSVIHYSSAAPIFTSIDLFSSLGVHLKDLVSTPVNLVSNLVASNYSSSYYALVDSATTCNGNITYSEVIPKTNSPVFTTPGNYKVCVAIANQSGQKIYGASAIFAYSRESVIAKINNAPTGISSDSALNVTINGSLVDEYKFKVGVSASTNCKAAAGYSSAQSVATPITSDISALANGSITLCVIGLNVDGKDQLGTQPSSHTWVKNSINLKTLDLKAKSRMNEWHDVAISKNTSPRLYASTTRGKVFLSNDRGTTWEFQCSVPFDATSRIVTSNASSPLAFITSNGEIYRIEAAPMPGACPSITGSIGTLVTSFKRIPLVINNKNELYIVEQLNSSTSYIKFSNDNGETWSLKQTISGAGSSVNLFLDPIYNNNMQITASTYDSVLLSQNALLSLEAISFPTLSTPTAPADTTGFLKVTDVELKFDPVTAGRIYSNNNLYSTNYGESWSYSNNFNDNLRRWDIRNDGTAYRLNQSGADVLVQTASSGSGTASLFKTLTSLTLDGKEAISTSGDGQTIMAIVSNKAFLSLNGGNFTQLNSPDTTHFLSSLASADGSTIYGVDYGWNYYKSTDGGVNSSYMTNYSTACSVYPRIQTNKSNVNYVYSYAFDGATNTGCTQNFFSIDGLTSKTTLASSLASPAPVVAINQADSTKVTVHGTTTTLRSLNSGSSFSSFAPASLTLNLQNPDGAMSTTDSNISWMIPDNSRLIETDLSVLSKTDVTNRLTFATPSGVEGFSDGSLLVISKTGGLNYSSDTLTYSNLNPMGATLFSCQRRLLRSFSADPNIIASACYRSTYISYTKDSGINWTEINLSNYAFSSSCVINDIAIVAQGANKKIAISCIGSESLLFNID